MKRQPILVWIVVMTAGTSVYSSEWQADWVKDYVIPPSWSWGIFPSPLHYPPPSHPPGTIPFSGPTGVFSNDCWARFYLGGTPTITIDENQKTIELWFGPPFPGSGCLAYYDPVCGINGWFGPLSEGSWLFYSDRLNFYINIHVGCPLAVLNPNGGERLLSGSTYTIRWEDARYEGCGGNYLLAYSVDDGSGWIPIETNPVSNTCSYDWQIPPIVSHRCLIRITDTDDPNMSDMSDNSFRISTCKYSILGDWDGDCKIDFGDFSIIAVGFNVHGGTDMNDLAGLVQSWLDCASPFDPNCRIGGPMPDFPVDGSFIDGDYYPPLPGAPTHIYTPLIFIPSATAVNHTGYFSDDVLDVYNRTQDANLGQPPFPEDPGYEYRYYVGLPVYDLPYQDSLVRGTKYYWTVDERDALGNTYPGSIWEFTIQDSKATLPNPPNEATLVETDVLLSWQPGLPDPPSSSVDHYVFIGTSWEDVNNARYDRFTPPPEFLGVRSEPNIAVTSLELNTTYYWRVDEALWFPPPPGGFVFYYKGDVWSFTTIPSANNGGFINLKDYAVPSNYRQKTGPILPADFHKDDVIDYKDLRILIPGQQSLNERD